MLKELGGFSVSEQIRCQKEPPIKYLKWVEIKFGLGGCLKSHEGNWKEMYPLMVDVSTQLG